jgi:hypothetical protein
MGLWRGSGSDRSARLRAFPSLGQARSVLDFRRDADINEWIQSTLDAASNWRSNWRVSGQEASEDNSLLLVQLRSSTDAFLNRHRSLNANQRSNILQQLIERHTQKDIAFLACVHGLTTEAAQEALRGGFQIHASQTEEVVNYLRVVVAARDANPEIIDDLEAQWAESLILLSTSTPQDMGPPLKALVRPLSQGLPNLPFLQSLAYDIPHKACFRFSNHVEQLGQEKNFGQAYAACAWLSELQQTSPLVVILNEIFPSWPVWAAWRPNYVRLRLWECLTVDQRRRVQDFLSLEGPDFFTGKLGTLREGLSLPKTNLEIRHGSIVIKVPNRHVCEPLRLLDQLLNTLDVALAGFPHGLAYFTQLCVDRSVTHEELQILQAAHITGNTSIHAGVLQTLGDQTLSIQMAGVSQILPPLEVIGNQGHVLRELISPLLASVIPTGLESLQEKICKQIESGRDVEVDGMKIAKLVHGLRGAVWLHSKLDQRLHAFLDQFPPFDSLTALLKLRDVAQDTTLNRRSPLTRTIDTYCIAKFAGRPVVDEEAATIVDALLPFWVQRPDRERREAALAIAQRSFIPFKTRSECLSKLRGAPEKLLDGVRRSNDTDVACFHFARVLCSPKVYGSGLDECWQHLLRSMIENRGPRLAESVFDQLGIDDWFRWQDDLRKILFSGDTRPTSQHPLLQWRFSRWSERLSSQHLSAIKLIETTGNGLGLKWIVLGSEDSGTIFTLLQALQRSRERPCDPAIQAMIKTLKPDGRNAKLISDALLRLSYMTEAGVQACLRAVNLYNESSGKVSEGSMSGLLQSADLTPADGRAVHALTAVLNGRP